MCGRFYVDEWTEREIHRIYGAVKVPAVGDVRPSEKAVVLLKGREPAKPEIMRWGFLKKEGKGLLINARTETVFERVTFRDGMRRCRCVIPAAGFYEWDKEKQKAAFFREDSPILYMAGIYQRYGEENRFVILTTKANESAASVHDRMPLILEESELDGWLGNDERAKDMLRMSAVRLKKKQEYEQQRLPFL